MIHSTQAKKYSSEFLKGFPTISKSHFWNLKIETETKRIFLCRCGIADGMQFENMVCVERLISGKWVQTEFYKG